MDNDTKRFRNLLVGSVIVGAILGGGLSSIPFILWFVAGMMFPIEKVADYLKKAS